MEEQLSKGGPKRRWRSLVLGVAACLALVAAFPWVVLKASADPAEIRADRTLWSFEQAETLRPYRLPSDGTIDAEESATSFVQIVQAPETGDSVWQNRPDADVIAGSSLVGEGGPLSSCPAGATGCGRDLIQPDSAFPAAASGFTDAEREYLRAFEHHPALPALSRLARADRLSELRAYELLYGEPLIAPDETFWDLPLPRYSRARELAYQVVGLAALRYAEGDAPGAEELLRELISVGLLMYDESTNLLGALVGAVFVRTGGNYLPRLLELEGRAEQALIIEQSLGEVEAGGPRDQGGWVPVSLDFVVDSSQNRAFRWALLENVLYQSTCLQFKTVMWGPPDSVVMTLEGPVRDQLVRYPEDAWLYDRQLNWVQDGLRREPDRLWLRLSWHAARLLGPDRLAACLTLIDVRTAPLN